MRSTQFSHVFTVFHSMFFNDFQQHGVGQSAGSTLSLDESRSAFEVSIRRGTSQVASLTLAN